jgi:predicted secreted protein
MKTVFGYNILFRINDGGTEKYLAGTTSNSFSITPEVKDSITKADKGFKKSKVTGYGYEFSAEGLVNMSESGDTSKDLTKSEIIALTTAGGEIDFTYGGAGSGDEIIKGKVIITGYSENSDSENEATYSVNFRGVSEFTTGTVA